MANHALPTNASAYANYTTEVMSRIDDAIKWLDPATTSPTNIPTNAIRWNSASFKFEKWNGTAWGNLISDFIITGNMSANTFTEGGTLLSNKYVPRITSVDNQLIRFDGTTGAIQGSGVVVDDSGNVGIGTNTPLSPLHIYKANINDTTENRIQISRFYDGRGASLMQSYRADSFSDDLMIAVDSINSNDLTKTKYRVSSNGIHTFYGATTSQERMRIDASGNVGIGETNPLSKLVISNGSGENFEFFTGNGTLNGGGFEYVNRGDVFTRPDLNYYLSSEGGAHKFFTNRKERMRIDASGNVGIGVTPSAWAEDNAIQLPHGSISSGYEYGLSSVVNAYRTSGDIWKYNVSQLAMRYNINNNGHHWQIAPSGTAGSAITWTTAMTLDASGALSVSGDVTAPTFVGNLSGNATTATTAEGTSFSTAPAPSDGESRIRCKTTGQNDAYMFNNQSYWGMYSESGGFAFWYDRDASIFNFNGNAGNGVIASSMTENGYVKLGNGLIIQWGTVTGILTNATSTVTLPIAFTTAILNLSGTMKRNASGSNDAGIWVYPSGLTQILVSNENSVTSDAYWFAIGY